MEPIQRTPSPLEVSRSTSSSSTSGSPTERRKSAVRFATQALKGDSSTAAKDKKEKRRSIDRLDKISDSADKIDIQEKTPPIVKVIQEFAYEIILKKTAIQNKSSVKDKILKEQLSDEIRIKDQTFELLAKKILEQDPVDVFKAFESIKQLEGSDEDLLLAELLPRLTHKKIQDLVDLYFESESVKNEIDIGRDTTTLASKLASHFQASLLLSHLKKTFKAALKSSFEEVPTKEKLQRKLLDNTSGFLLAVESVITSSKNEETKKFYSHLVGAIKKVYPDSDAPRHAVNFLFLRFICPVLTNPSKNGMDKVMPAIPLARVVQACVNNAVPTSKNYQFVTAEFIKEQQACLKRIASQLV